jgi:putative membrane protein
MAPPAPGTVPPGGTTAALSTPQIVAVLTASDSAEIKPSQLAMQKAQNADVKAYAQRMITDHGMLEDSLKALERQENLSPAPNAMSQQIETQTRSTLQQLQGLSGAEFDRAYMQAMVQSHQSALNAVDTQLLPAAQDPKVKMALEQKVRPIIVAHLESAQEIQRSLGSS